MTEDPAAARIHRALQEALSAGEVPACSEGGLVTGWILVGEYIAPDGDPGWYLVVDSDSSVARSMGLLALAEQVLREHVRVGLLGTETEGG